MTSNNGYDFVLDCSMTMAWLFEDEGSKHTDQVLEKLENAKAIVPSIWPLEVANVLLFAQRKKRITAIQASSFIDALAALPIHVDSSTQDRALHSIYTLAHEENLTIYDAAYLELAIRENIPLATLDHDLLKAIQKLKISNYLNRG
jgi:predicted nucleic acid-binding protein